MELRGGQGANDEEPFLPHLPLTLTTLVFHEIWAPYSNIIKNLADPAILPALRHLLLSDVTQPDEVGSEVEEEGEVIWRSACEKLEDMMAKIELFCAERLIELRWES